MKDVEKKKGKVENQIRKENGKEKDERVKKKNSFGKDEGRKIGKSRKNRFGKEVENKR